MSDDDLIAKSDGVLKVDRLRKPDLYVKFLPNPNGTYSAHIPLDNSGNPNEIPLLRVAEKKLDKLQAVINNALLEEGIKTRYGKISIELTAGTSGKGTLGGNLNGETGEVERISAGKVSGGLNGNGEIGGKLSGNLKLEIQPGVQGLSAEMQRKLQDVLDRKCNEIFKNWAEDMSDRGGAMINLGPGQPTLQVTPRALDRYIEENKSPLDHIKGMWKSSDSGQGVSERSEIGFASPDHPYHRMYTDALQKIGEMTPRPGGDQKPETIAAALVKSAADAKFDPDKSIALVAGGDGHTLIAVQGPIGDPASRQAHIDATQAKAPSAEQIAQLQPSAREETIAQTRQTTQGLG